MTQSWLWGSQIVVKKKKKEKARQLFDDEDVDNKHYTAIKNLSRLLTSLNATHKGQIFLFFFFFFFLCVCVDELLEWFSDCVSKRWLLWVLQQQRSRQSNIFLQKLCTKCGGETDPLLKIQNWACLWISSLKVYTICLYSMSRLRATKISKFRCRSLTLISNETILNKIQKRFRATITDKIFGT